MALNLVSQLENALLIIQHTGKRKQLKDKKESQYSSKTSMNLRDLVLEFTEKLKESKQYWEKVVIIVDGLDKITQDTISTQVLDILESCIEIMAHITPTYCVNKLYFVNNEMMCHGFFSSKISFLAGCRVTMR